MHDPLCGCTVHCNIFSSNKSQVNCLWGQTLTLGQIEFPRSNHQFLIINICIKLDFFNPEKQDLEAEERTSAQHHSHIDEAPNAAAPSIVQKPVNFPTSIRKRSIPYGKVTADGNYFMSFNNYVDQILPNFDPAPSNPHVDNGNFR